MKKVFVAVMVMALGMGVLVSCGSGAAKGGDWKPKMAKMEQLSKDMVGLMIKMLSGDTNSVAQMGELEAEITKLGEELDAIYKDLPEAEKKLYDAEKERIGKELDQM
ncbi:MAG: hypothetical protein HPY53_13830 [Brevinematales bacterium]|nr:hypothetical protein [Brevinematales bacterium]